MLISSLEKKGKNVLSVDGDTIRSAIYNHFDFSPNSIKNNNLAIIDLCKEKISLHDYIIVSVISPLEKNES